MRKVDLNLLQTAVEGTSGQQISTGFSKTTDPNFPVLPAFVNERILVYIPKTNVTMDENGETMNLCRSHRHDYTDGRSFGQLRCIHDLVGKANIGTPNETVVNAAYAELGYDGECPCCLAKDESWKLYNLRLDMAARQAGFGSAKDDTADTLKATREQLLKDKIMKDAEKFVTFPVVHILLDSTGKLKYPEPEKLKDNFVPYFADWREVSYNDRIGKELDAGLTTAALAHPAGRLWYFDYRYDTKGQKATPMLAAKNLKTTKLPDSDAQGVLDAYAQICEEVAREFTCLKVVEVVKAANFWYKDDLTHEVGRLMSNTRKQIEILSSAAPVAPTVGAQVSPNQAALNNFGQAQVAPGFGAVPQNIGQAPAPVVGQAPAPVVGQAPAPAVGQQTPPPAFNPQGTTQA